MIMFRYILVQKVDLEVGSPARPGTPTMAPASNSPASASQEPILCPGWRSCPRVDLLMMHDDSPLIISSQL